SYVAVILGDSKVASALLQLKFDYIFFTGGIQIGKMVYEAASKNLTPVTLELGGKSPVIIDSSAKLSLTAKRIAFGKFINCGQTCVAPDYVLVPSHLKEELIKELIGWINQFYPNGMHHKHYGKIINEKHFNRLLGYLEGERILYGGNSSKEDLKLEPTLLEVNENHKIMKEEIFGPILPILTYQKEEEIYSIIAKHPTPLALYIFSNDKRKIKEYIAKIQFGGGCINDTIIHLATNTLPFGGIGTSGIGSYHGKKSFETFTHYKSILHKANWIDLPMRYSPYTKTSDKLIHKFLK
ncbi:MAG: aldehyde dehydrogenase family protein, partial [Anaeroplasmataceae bacterium]|nr:aldehyde dehydrogenase family protein [Anaeroplasmataceae bacterium]